MAIEIIAIGDNFRKGKPSIGRERLPAGFVAFLDDPAALTLAIKDLHIYATQKFPQKPKHGIVFRVVKAAERDGVNHKIKSILGISDFLENAELFCPPLAHWHFLDSEHIAHICNRHSSASSEQQLGNIPVNPKDFERIPEVINPKNIRSFQSTRDCPRIIYEMKFKLQTIVIVQELSKHGVFLKTMYKKIKVAGDIRLASDLAIANLYVRNEPACATTFNNWIIDYISPIVNNLRRNKETVAIVEGI